MGLVQLQVVQLQVGLQLWLLKTPLVPWSSASPGLAAKLAACMSDLNAIVYADLLGAKLQIGGGVREVLMAPGQDSVGAGVAVEAGDKAGESVDLCAHAE